MTENKSSKHYDFEVLRGSLELQEALVSESITRLCVSSVSTTCLATWVIQELLSKVGPLRVKGKC